MSERIKEIIRDRRLTEEEAAKYREIRQLVAQELPELRARAKARLRELREVAEVFAELKKVRESRGLSLGDLQQLTGIDRSASRSWNVVNGSTVRSTRSPAMPPRWGNTCFSSLPTR